ncbi:MAG: S9 family peptidase [Bacteroidaceae bacterium]|nr:S9 family peptidase [Bacteroidaceae bacterium]
MATLTLATSCEQTNKTEGFIGRNDITLQSDTMTPEALWAMGRIGSYAASPDGTHIAYQMTYYSVEENRSHTVLWMMNADGSENRMLTTAAKSESDPAWLDNGRLAFLTEGEVWTMDADGKNRKQITQTDGSVDGFLFSPDGKKVILIKSVPYHEIIQERPADLPKSTGRVITDLMYRHWDHYVESIPHPFVLDLASGEEFDILEGEPYECPMEPFGGIEQLAWSPDSKFIAFTCRTKTGLEYSISTDSDIYLYDVEAHDLNNHEHTKNLCKEFREFGICGCYEWPYHGDGGGIDPTKTMKFQEINSEKYIGLNNGYDFNPKFSPDGKYVAWLSMERAGYEADRQRLCVCDLQTGKKRYVTESFDSNVDDFCWDHDSHTLYYIGVWHATVNLYCTNLEGEVTQLTNEWADWGSLQMLNDGKRLLMERHSFLAPADLYVVDPNSKEYDEEGNIAIVQQITNVNKDILDQLGKPSVDQRWVKTTDGQEMLYWIIQPPHFDPNKKYPTLLFCEGGPQSPVSQFWSYRWNFFIMASQGYVVIAPNRRGLPGFGQEWLEEISGDWTGQCMKDYLTAIDDACDQLPYVDRDHLGAVGASFGGFSVYYLAGHHERRFKCFISHDGAFNLEAMYTETEENWFSNWEYDDAYWNKDQTDRARKTYENSPHHFVDKWDTPILCIHGEKDYRINATQGMSAFNAARMRGIEAELLLYPDENHWVLKPQNGILWQRTFFSWLDRWLK